MSQAQPKQFRYKLLVRGVNEYELPQAPSGWEEALIKWSRSTDYYGMFRSFTVPMNFVLDGAWILRTEFYTYGIRANVQITIEELDLSDWGYDLVYIGDIDFSTFSDELNQVTVKVMEGGISAMIKAYENVKYTIDLDVPEAVDILIPGLQIQETASLILLPQISDPKADVFIGLDVVSNEQQANVSSVQSVEFQQNSSPNFATSDHWFYEAQADTDVQLEGRIVGSLVTTFGAGTGDKTFSIRLYKDNGAFLTLYSHLGDDDTNSFPIDFTYNVTANMNTGDRLFMYLEISGGTAFNSGFRISEGTINASYNTVSTSTMCKALRPKYVFEKLLEKINNDVAYPIRSSLLDTWEQLTITSGDAIRQIPDPKLKTSFKDFFTSINAVLNAGFGIESNTATLEEKAYFFKKDLMAQDTGVGKDFNLEIYDEYIFNSVKVGYPDPQFNAILNGRDEINSTQTWTLPLVRIQRELNLLSVYRADPYGIEDIRITFRERNTINDNNDNDVFFIKIKDAPESGETYYMPERSEGYISLTKIDGNPLSTGDTLYNWDLTPKRNLLRHGNFLHSVLDKFEGYQIKFASAARNTDVVIIDNNGLRTQENEDIDVSTLPDKIFLPYIVSVIAKLPVDTLQMIDSFPTGYIRTNYLDNNYDGFMIDAAVDISKNSEREFKLLLTPNNLLLNLIR